MFLSGSKLSKLWPKFRYFWRERRTSKKKVSDNKIPRNEWEHNLKSKTAGYSELTYFHVETKLPKPTLFQPTALVVCDYWFCQLSFFWHNFIQFVFFVLVLSNRKTLKDVFSKMSKKKTKWWKTSTFWLNVFTGTLMCSPFIKISAIGGLSSILFKMASLSVSFSLHHQ